MKIPLKFTGHIAEIEIICEITGEIMKKVLIPIFSGLIAISCTKKSDKNADDASVIAPPSNSNGGSVVAAKLTADNCTDPDLSKLDAGETFMLCDGTIGEGTRVADSPVSPDPWDVRYGVTVGATTGKLKINCRNMVGHYDKDNGLSSDNGGGYSGGSDVWDTVDDYDWNGSATVGVPSTNPWPGGDEHFCGYNSPTDPTWERVITTPATSGDESVYRDRISGLNWTRGNDTSGMDWDSAEGNSAPYALEYCNSLNHGGITAGNWRVPTQKELMAAYEHGIHDLDDDHTATDNLGDLDSVFWSSSTRSNSTSSAWFVFLGNGSTNNSSKTDSYSVLCVAP